MKKLFFSAISLMVAMAFAACGNSASNNGGEQQSGEQEQAAPSSASSVETSNFANDVAQKLSVNLDKVAAGAFGANGEIMISSKPKYNLTLFFKDKLDASARSKWLDNFLSQFKSASADGKLYASGDFAAEMDKADEDQCFPDGYGARFFVKIGEHQFMALVTYGETNYLWTDGNSYPHFDSNIERLD